VKSRRKNKKKTEQQGPKMFTCPYCGEQVSRRKSREWHGGRICKTHFCGICGLPSRPEQSVYIDEELPYVCEYHRCRLCNRKTLTGSAARITEHGIICSDHACKICGKIVPDKDSIIIGGKRTCKTHNYPGKGKKE